MFTTIDQESEMSQFEHILTTPERLGCKNESHLLL